MKKTIAVILLMTILLGLCACHEHTWIEASCTAPRICDRCGETEGSPVGHIITQVSCESPSVCDVCGKIVSNATGHSWASATCSKPKTCTVCSETEGAPLEHEWSEATCGEAAVCTICGEKNGEVLSHSKGSWEVVEEPDNGPGKKAVFCTRCGEKLEEKSYELPYYDMSFTEFVNAFNKEYGAQGITIANGNGGYWVRYNGKDRTLVFHDDKNVSSTNGSYGTGTLTQFNQLTIRANIPGTDYDPDGQLLVTMYAGLAAKILTGEDDPLADFGEKGKVIEDSNLCMIYEYETISNKYVFRVLFDRYSNQSYYELVIRTK